MDDRHRHDHSNDGHPQPNGNGSSMPLAPHYGNGAQHFGPSQNGNGRITHDEHPGGVYFNGGPEEEINLP